MAFLICSIDKVNEVFANYICMMQRHCFINEALEFHVGETAQHGLMSLSGVANDDVSIVIPSGLWLRPEIDFDAYLASEWALILSLIYPDYYDDISWLRNRMIYDQLVPFFDMANHSSAARRPSAEGDKMVVYGSCVDYGEHFCV